MKSVPTAKLALRFAKLHYCCCWNLTCGSRLCDHGEHCGPNTYCSCSMSVSDCSSIVHATADWSGSNNHLHLQCSSRFVLLQYCDRGNLERACETSRFMNKLDKTPDMVCTATTIHLCRATLQHEHLKTHTYLHSASVVAVYKRLQTKLMPLYSTSCQSVYIVLWAL